MSKQKMHLKKDQKKATPAKSRTPRNPTMQAALQKALYGKGEAPQAALAEETQQQLPVGDVVGPYTPTSFHLAGQEAVLAPHQDPAFAGMDDLDDEVRDAANNHGESNEESAEEEPSLNVDLSGGVLGNLAKKYLAQSINDQKRTPSAALRSEYRTRLLKFQALFLTAQKVLPAGRNHEVAQLIAIVQALAAESKVDAIILIRNVMKQTMWHATLDYNRAMRGEGVDGDDTLPDSADYRQMSAIDRLLAQNGIVDRRDEVATPPIGLGNDPLDYDENDVLEAIVEVNGWLGTVADLLPGNDEERAYLNLTNGLQYLDEPIEDRNAPNGRRWEPVYDATKAIEVQQIANRVSMKKRQERDIQQKRGQFDALERIARGTGNTATK